MTNSNFPTLSKLTLGLWEVGGFPFYRDLPMDQAISLIRYALKIGVYCFDTAPVYGFGRAETILGKALGSDRKQAFISTKCGLKWEKEKISSIYHCNKKPALIAEAEDSLRRLNTDYIDAYLLHWPNPQDPLNESIEALEILKQQGKIRYYGVSNFSWAGYQEAKTYGQIQLVQNRYNILRPVDAFTFDPQLLVHEDAVFQAYSPLERGLLTEKSREILIKEGEAAVVRHIKKMENPQLSRLEILKAQLQTLADTYSLSLPALAVNLLFHVPGVDTAIIGTRNKTHLKAIQDGLAMKIDPAQVDFG